MKNDNFRRALYTSLSDVRWTERNSDAVMKMVKSEARRVRRMTVGLVAILILCLAFTAYAAYESSILTNIFRNTDAPESAVELLDNEPVIAGRNGVTFTVSEYLFDGQTLRIANNVRNDTGDTLIYALGDLKINGQAVGDTDFGWGSGLNAVEPDNERASVNMAQLTGISYTAGAPVTISLRAIAIKPVGEVMYNGAGGEMIDWYDYISSEYGEWMNALLKRNAAGEEIDWDAEFASAPDDIVTYSVNGNGTLIFDGRIEFEISPEKTASIKTARAEAANYDMHEYGYKLSLEAAEFAPTRVYVKFSVIPDDVKDILAYGNEGQDGHERLYRHYKAMARDADGADVDLRLNSTFGWDEGKTRLIYALHGDAPDFLPDELILVPIDAFDSEKLLTDEAIPIPLNEN